ncbi:MAG: hypothetical protein A2Z88_05565 [Omnitrophica WOR_2 bacterium GWA2_47_8]|nr:MAG: hypothetical protein A2Z88_05565 [Omnitrophica WOR_2 bacterium GWA2_47_8]
MNVLIENLFTTVPEFKSLIDEQFEEETIFVFETFSTYLKDKIKNEDATGTVEKSCQFINELVNNKFSLIEDKGFDEFLIYDLFEPLVSSKKCNDQAKKLLKNRALELYDESIKKNAGRANTED